VSAAILVWLVMSALVANSLVYFHFLCWFMTTPTKPTPLHITPYANTKARTNNNPATNTAQPTLNDNTAHHITTTTQHISPIEALKHTSTFEAVQSLEIDMALWVREQNTRQGRDWCMGGGFVACTLVLVVVDSDPKTPTSARKAVPPL